MASRSDRSPIWTTPLAVGLILALALALPTLAGDEPAEPEAAAKAAAPRTVTVGKAKLTWHLTPKASVQRAELVTAFKQATEAHLTGGEPYVSEKAKPVTLPGGQLMMRLPVELIPATFVSPEGRSYCSDSTVTAAPASADGEGR